MITEEDAADIRAALHVLNARLKQSGVKRWEVEVRLDAGADGLEPVVEISVKQKL